MWERRRRTANDVANKFGIEGFFGVCVCVSVYFFFILKIFFKYIKMKLYVEFINDINKIMSMIFLKLLFAIGGMPDIYTCLFCVFGIFSFKKKR